MADLQAEAKLDRIKKGGIRSSWGDLTDDDIDRARGDIDNLIGTIKEKTGEGVDSIKEKLGELFRDEDRGGRYAAPQAQGKGVSL